MKNNLPGTVLFLRPKVSAKPPNWEKKRAEMKKVCGECHQNDWVKGFYAQFDRFVTLYNDKFAKPAKGLP